MKTTALIFATLLVFNGFMLAYLYSNHREQNKQISELQSELNNKLDLVKSLQITQDKNGTSFHVIIPKDINNSNAIWLRIKVNKISNLKEFTIVN